ncbi:MAG: hypothetical protein ACXWF2_10080, partial [Usitatibacter sp.]
TNGLLCRQSSNDCGGIVEFLEACYPTIGNGEDMNPFAVELAACRLDSAFLQTKSAMCHTPAEVLASSEIVSYYQRLAERAARGSVVGAVTLILMADGLVEFRTLGVLDDQSLIEKVRSVATARSEPQ